MSYVIYIAQEDPNDSTHVLKEYKVKKVSALPRLRAKYPNLSIHMTSREDFDKNIVKMVTRKNLLSGKEFKISSEDADTFMDPSTETYHSM